MVVEVWLCILQECCILSCQHCHCSLCTSAWGSSRCCSNIPHSLQKIKQTNEKLTPLLTRDAPVLMKLPLASPAGADGGGCRAHLGLWRWCR
jgi:hypothetical protein